MGTIGKQTKNKKGLRLWALITTLIMLLGQYSALAANNDKILSADQTLRILLRRLYITDRVDVTLHGQYALHSGAGVMVLKEGSKVVVLKQNNQLYVYLDQLHFNGGDQVAFKRYGLKEGENGLRLFEGANLYEGDLLLTNKEQGIEPVLHIHVEDYLLGVVPYEMSDSFPLEALKAQAISARTYAMGRAGNSGSYDLVDTTNDQVYKGKNEDHVKAAQAIRETAGVIGAYKGNFADCYYTASNGGQTELASHIWGGKDPGYIIMQDDPYDLKNPQSPVRNHTIYKNPSEERPASNELRQVLAQAMESTLTQKGYSPKWENLRIDEVTGVKLESPKYKEPSRLYTQLTLTFSYSGKTIVGTTAPQQGKNEEGLRSTSFNMAHRLRDGEKKGGTNSEPLVYRLNGGVQPTPTPFFAGPPIVGEQGNEIDFFETAPPQNNQEGLTQPNSTPQPDGNVQPDNNFQPQATAPAIQNEIPLPTATPDPYIYSDFIKESTPVTLTLSLFPDVDRALGLSINQGGNELIILAETGDAFVLSARRFGHGVGLSQRGAQQMGEEGKTYEEILGFYYPTMELVTLPQTDRKTQAVDPVMIATPGPRVTPTPRPTLMPLTQGLGEGEKLGEVDNIEESSYLNLRAEPNMSSKVLLPLYKGQQLIILPTATEAGWYHVKTDVVQGYVSAEFIKVNPQ